MRTALVDKYDKGTNYDKYFSNIDIDIYHLSSNSKKKLLKADMDIEIEVDNYDFIILVGAEPTKYFTNVAVSSHQGYLVEEKFIPLIDPGMLVFKPDMQSSMDRAISNINQYIEGTKTVPIKRTSFGWTDEKAALLELKKILALSPRPVAIDTETGAFYPRDGIVLGISIAASIDEGHYISSDIFSEECTEVLQQIVYKHTPIFHNAKFDISFLQYHFGINFKLVDLYDHSTFEDTMLQHYVLDETTGTHGLKENAIKYTDLGDYDRELDQYKKDYCRKHKILQKDFTYDLIPFDIIFPYAATDAMATLELYQKFDALIKDKRIMKAYTFLKTATKFLIKMENNGVPFNKDKLLSTQKELADDIYKLEQAIYKIPEVAQTEKELGVIFNPNSVIHLRHLFYKVLNLPKTGRKTAKGEDSVDAESLIILSKLHPVVKKISAIKKAKKIKSTYIDKILVGLDADGRLRTGFNLHTTTSGRLSSSGKLNMQQLPRDDKRVKACITALPGYKIISQDLATAEMYVAAVLADDYSLQHVFIAKQAGIGADFHSTIAHMVFNLRCLPDEVKKLFPELRQAAKAISFGILYGSGPQKVADTVNDEGDGTFTIENAVSAINKYFKQFPELKKWLSKNQKFIKENGFIYSIFNRKRRLGNVFSSDRAAAGHEVRSGINFLVQSVASDINLMAAIAMQNAIYASNIDAEIFALVHDSILAIVKDEDVDYYVKMLKEITQDDMGIMINGCPIGVDTEIGNDYSFK